MSSCDPLPPGLYIVATPIGNLGDITLRAADILRRVDVIAAEDRRVSRVLLTHIGVPHPSFLSYHEHNASHVRPQIIALMATKSVALISDAGTPLISDPGYKLVRAARDAGLPVTTLPGPCAAIAALTLAGLPTDRFFFIGFLPRNGGARHALLQDIANLRASIVFYETAPRLPTVLAEMASVLGPRRPAAMVREISKHFEEVVESPLGDLAARLSPTLKGEIVLIVGPGEDTPSVTTDMLDEWLIRALKQSPLSQAVADTAQALGLPRKQVYQRALEIRDAGETGDAGTGEAPQG